MALFDLRIMHRESQDGALVSIVRERPSVDTCMIYTLAQARDGSHKEDLSCIYTAHTGYIDEMTSSIVATLYHINGIDTDVPAITRNT